MVSSLRSISGSRRRRPAQESRTRVRPENRNQSPSAKDKAVLSTVAREAPKTPRPSPGRPRKGTRSNISRGSNTALSTAQKARMYMGRRASPMLRSAVITE